MARVLLKTQAASGIGAIKNSMLTEVQFQAQNGSGWVLCDGRDVTGSDYDTLTGNTTLPDARGQFLRGKSHGRSDGQENPDGDSALGTAQTDAFDSHSHTLTGVQSPLTAGNRNVLGSFASGPANSAESTTSDGGNETRPKNITINIFIKINEA